MLRAALATWEASGLVGDLAERFAPGLVAFVLKDYQSPKTEDRLDFLIGKRKEDPTTDILRKSAFESDKRSLLELITPNLPSLKRIFEQADISAALLQSE